MQFQTYPLSIPEEPRASLLSSYLISSLITEHLHTSHIQRSDAPHNDTNVNSQTGFNHILYVYRNESHDFLQTFVYVFYLISKRSVMSPSGQAQTWIWSGERWSGTTTQKASMISRRPE